MNKTLSWSLHSPRQVKAHAGGTEPCEEAPWGVTLPQALWYPPTGTLEISAGISNLWYVALPFQIFDNEAKDLEREVCFIDIACDEIPERYYKESEVSSRWMTHWESFVRAIIHSFIQQILFKWLHPGVLVSLCWLNLVSRLARFLNMGLKIQSLLLRARHRPCLQLLSIYSSCLPDSAIIVCNSSIHRAQPPNMLPSLSHSSPASLTLHSVRAGSAFY